MLAHLFSQAAKPTEMDSAFLLAASNPSIDLKYDNPNIVVLSSDAGRHTSYHPLIVSG